MKGQKSIRSCWALVLILAGVVAAACEPGDRSAVKGRANPAGAPGDSVSDLALTEDGLGQIQVGMPLTEAVNMGLLSENPNMKSECHYVFPAVGTGIPEGVSVMIVRGEIARIDVDTGAVMTEEGARIGDTEERIKSIYGADLKVEPHKYIDRGHYLTVLGDSASAGRALVFETDGQRVTMFRGGRLPEVGWVEACG